MSTCECGSTSARFDETIQDYVCANCGGDFDDWVDDESTQCKYCNGTGLDWEGLGDCEHCDGMGYEWWW